MTKKKPVQTEIVEGSGASAGLVLILKPGSLSGYYGVIPNGKGWRACVYKSSKQKWDDAGTYNTPRDAAIQAAIAQRELDKGFGWQYSPLKKRPQKGPLCVLAHALSCLPHKLKHAPTSQPSIQCSHVKVKSPPRVLMPSTALVNGWMRSCPAFCCPLHTPTLPPHACSGIRLTVPFVVLSGTAAAALDAVAEEDENAGDLFNPSLELSKERKCAIVRCVALVPDGSMYTRCVCSRTVVAGCKCLCGRVPAAQSPDPDISTVPARPVWSWVPL